MWLIHMRSFISEKLAVLRSQRQGDINVGKSGQALAWHQSTWMLSMWFIDDFPYGWHTKSYLPVGRGISCLGPGYLKLRPNAYHCRVSTTWVAWKLVLCRETAPALWIFERNTNRHHNLHGILEDLSHYGIVSAKMVSWSLYLYRGVLLKNYRSSAWTKTLENVLTEIRLCSPSVVMIWPVPTWNNTRNSSHLENPNWFVYLWRNVEDVIDSRSFFQPPVLSSKGSLFLMSTGTSSFTTLHSIKRFACPSII